MGDDEDCDMNIQINYSSPHFGVDLGEFDHDSHRSKHKDHHHTYPPPNPQMTSDPKMRGISYP